MIAPSWFLTAAHCVVRQADQRTLVGNFIDDEGTAVEGILEVVLGHDDLKSVTPGSVYPVDRIVVHDTFMAAYRGARAEGLSETDAVDRATISGGHDIAVVRLKRAWRGEVARLLLQPTEPRQHRWSADVLGFGHVDRVAEKRRMRRYTRANKEVYFAGSSRLIKVGVPLVDTARCARRYVAKYPGASIGAGQICAGADAGGRDSCQGDSGGPLVASYQDSPELYQIALVSWGHGCAEPGWPGIYTRLSDHADWLRAAVAGLSPRLAAPDRRGHRASVGPAVAGPPGTAPIPLKLRFANSNPQFGDPSVAGGAEFAEELNKLAAGKLAVAHFFAGELVPSGGPTIDAVTWGAANMAWVSPAQNFRKSSAFALLGNAVPFGMDPERLAAWMRGEGGYLMGRLFDQYNIHALPCAITGERGSGWFRRPLEGVADLQGLKIRIGDFYAQIVTRAGALPQRTPGHIVWHSLQDGRLDAALFETPAVDERVGLYKVAPHYYYPGWHYRNALVALLIGDRTWASMDAGQRQLIESACDRNVHNTLTRFAEADAQVTARLVSAGAQLEQLPREVEMALRKATEEFFAEEAAVDSDFRAVLESYRKYQLATAPVVADPLLIWPPPIAASVPPPVPEEARPKRAVRKTAKKDADMRTWRDEVFQPP